jgi:hypothetical protein
VKAKVCLLEVMQELCQWILTQRGPSFLEHQVILPAGCGLLPISG